MWLNLILTETNRYGSTKKDTFEPLDEIEFWKFLALCLHMGIERRAHLKEYWSTRPVYIGICGWYYFLLPPPLRRKSLDGTRVVQLNGIVLLMETYLSPNEDPKEAALSIFVNHENRE
ncbi:hypothetical protein OSTOST_16609 [Ostertagia ostertagi]